MFLNMSKNGNRIVILLSKIKIKVNELEDNHSETSL